MTNKINSLISEAINLFQNNSTEEAEKVIKKILRVENLNPIAIEILGLIKIKNQNYKDALPLFKKAIFLNPNSLSTRNNYAKVLEELGNYRESIKIYITVLRTDKLNYLAWMGLSKCLGAIEKNTFAIASLNNAIKINSQSADAWFSLGTINLRLNKHHDALTCFNSSIKISPDNFYAYFLKGLTFLYLKQFSEALECLNHALELRPDNAEAWSQKGIALTQLMKYSEALECLNHALELRPDYAEAWSNLGVVYKKMKFYSQAINCYENAIKINPDFSEAISNMGSIYEFENNYAKAIELYKIAIQKNTNLAEAHNNLGQLYLRTFNFMDGWEEYEWRWRTREYKKYMYLQTNKPLWNGEENGSRLFVWSEQGIGDQILYASIFEDLSKLNIFPIISVDEKLLSIFVRSFPDIKFISNVNNLDDINFDYHIPLPSLGKFFRKNLVDFSKITRKYLETDKIIDLNLSKFVKRNKSTLFGLSWKSSNNKIGTEKSIPIKILSNFIKRDLQIINLQYGSVRDDLNEIFKITSNSLEYLENIDLYNDLESTLSLINLCDIVVTSSNTNAHLAGALGKKTFLLVPTGEGSLWYWHDLNGKSIWYPNTSIIRQLVDGDWNSAISQLNSVIES